MDFKKWDEIIKNCKYDMLFLMIYDCLKCNDIFNESKEFAHDEFKKTLIMTIYDAYMKDESHIDLAFICDVALDYKDEILNNEEFTKWDLLNKCYERI